MGIFRRAIRRWMRSLVDKMFGNTARETVVSQTSEETAEEVREAVTRPTVPDDTRPNESTGDIAQQWKERLAPYPVWDVGGSDSEIGEIEGTYYFTVCFDSNDAARRAVEKYREVLRQNGFCPEGERPDGEIFCKTADGKLYRVDTEHCFESDPDAPMIGFCTVDIAG